MNTLQATGRAKKSFFCFLLCILLTAGMPGSGNPLACQEAWKGDIKETDLNIAGLRRLMQEGKPLPKGLRLRYSRKYLNYVVFYDLQGQEIYFRYRKHRFDRRAERKVRGLIPGQSYEVFGDLEGLYLENRIEKKDSAAFSKYVANPNAVLLFRFRAARPLRLEQILF